MHPFDIIFIITAIITVIIGVRRGLVGELFRCIALAAGFFVAFLYQGTVASFLPRFLSGVSGPLSFFLAFVVTALLVLGIGWVVKKIVHLTPLGWADYLFGGTIGILKTVLFFWMICLACSAFPACIHHVRRSSVYQTYTKLPSPVRLQGLSAFRARLLPAIPYSLPPVKKMRIPDGK